MHYSASNLSARTPLNEQLFCPVLFFSRASEEPFKKRIFWQKRGPPFERQFKVTLETHFMVFDVCTCSIEKCTSMNAYQEILV